MTDRDAKVYAVAEKPTGELRARERALLNKKRLNRTERDELHVIWSALATQVVRG